MIASAQRRYYESIARPVLFLFPSEPIHNFTLDILEQLAWSKTALAAISWVCDAPRCEVRLKDLVFPNPIGLAAGMDKGARAMPAWAAMGFGFCEVGGVTAHGQPGNPRPRMFRAPHEEALVNRMGFNNPGADVLAERLATWRRWGFWPGHPVGVNLGKSKITPAERAPEDYAYSFSKLADLADFFVVNVSSPNTPGLRNLQHGAALAEILIAIEERQPVSRRPVLLKVAPDLELDELDAILNIATERSVDGIVATNTTVQRLATEDTRSAAAMRETGGMSGRPLKAKSLAFVKHIHASAHGALPIIGVGGVFDSRDAWELLAAGASLVQIYTSLVYRGPGVVREIVTGLARGMREAGLESICELTGSGLAYPGSAESISRRDGQAFGLRGFFE